MEVIVAAIDESLTEGGLAFPGLGDAGDRQFQTAVSINDYITKRPKLEG